MVRTMRILEQVRDSTTTELRPREVRLRSSRLSEEILSRRQLLGHSSAITTISSISLNSRRMPAITDTIPHSSSSVHILHSRCRTVRKLQIRSKCLFTVRKHLQHSSRRKHNLIRSSLRKLSLHSRLLRTLLRTVSTRLTVKDLCRVSSLFNRFKCLKIRAIPTPETFRL